MFCGVRTVNHGCRLAEQKLWRIMGNTDPISGKGGGIFRRVVDIFMTILTLVAIVGLSYFDSNRNRSHLASGATKVADNELSK